MQPIQTPRLIVAITGGIASGKSEVAQRFELLGVPVADADQVARALVEPGMPALDAIVKRFGTGILAADGRLDRAALRKRVFADETERHALEAILHPRIRSELQQQCIQANAPYAMAAIPLLAEGGGRTAYPWLDRILAIDLPREVQHERLLSRDGISPELAERMLQAQVDRANRLLIADDVIDNSGTLSALNDKVAELNRNYLRLAAERDAQHD